MKPRPSRAPDLQVTGSGDDVRDTYPTCFPLALGRLRAVCCNLLLRSGRGCTRIQLFPGKCSGNPQRFAPCDTCSHPNSLNKAKVCVFAFQMFLLN